MAYIEISNLPETLNLNDESVFPVVYQGETRKVKFNSMAKIFNYFTSISYNKTTGVYTFTRVDGTSALLSTDLQKSFKDVSLSNGIITFTAHSGETKTIDISIPDNSITFAKLAVALQTRIDSKYSKPGSGIPKADLSNEVQASLEKAETAIQDVSGKEDKSNKTGILDENSTDTQYPHAKAVYDNFVTRDEEIEKLQTENAQLLADHPDILDENNEFPSGTDLTLNGTGDLKMEVDVGGNSTQIQYEGYQLLDINQLDLDDVKVVDYGLNFVTINFSSVFESIGYLSCKLENKIYSFKGKLTDGRFEIRYYLNETQVGSADTVTSFKKIDNSNGLYDEVYITPSNGNTIDKITFSNMILVEGEYTSDTMPNWEPYVGNQASPNPTYKQDINNVEGEVEVKAESRNLFKPTLVNNGTDIQNIHCTISLDKDEFTLVSTGTDMYFGEAKDAGANYNNNLGIKIDVKGKEKIYFKITNSQLISTFFTAYNKNGISLGYTRILSTNSYYTIPENAEFVTMRFGYQGSTIGTTYKTKVMVSYDPIDEYIKYQEPNTVTFPLAQGQKLMLGDTLEDDGVHHKRRQIVLDGTENWVDYTTQVEGYYKAYCTTKKTNSKFGILTALCTHFKIVDVSLVARTDELLASNQFAVYISISSNIASTSANLKSWLAQQYANGTPVILEYELETETTETYTQAQQTAYNKLKEMQSYYDLTYVVGSSNNAQPILTAHAKKSLKVMQSEIDELKQAILNS